VFHFKTPGSGQNNLGDYVYGYFTAWSAQAGDRLPLVGNNTKCGYIEWNDDPTAPPTPATSVELSLGGFISVSSFSYQVRLLANGVGPVVTSVQGFQHSPPYYGYPPSGPGAGTPFGYENCNWSAVFVP
jgi:hypothetical protein